MATQRRAKLAIAYSPLFKRQSAWDTAIPAAELTRAFPATTPDYIAEDLTIEEIFDCTGEDTLTELVTGRLARLTLNFDVDPAILAGLIAFAYGVAAAPSGGTNEVQTLTKTATSGLFRLRVTVGFDTQTTATLDAATVDAAAIQAALNALSNVDPGDLVVSSTGPWPITAGGRFVNTDLALIEVVPVPATPLAGGTVTVVETTPGVGRTHAISRVSGYTLPLLTFYVGFRDSAIQPVIYKNVVISRITVRSQSRQRVTGSIDLVGSADLQHAVGFTMPQCQDIRPIRFGDCAVTLNGIEQMALNIVRDFEFVYDNAVLTGDHPFTGQGIDITRLERADRRPSGINIGLLGEPGDANHIAAKARTVMPAALRIGPANGNVTVTVPQGRLALDNPPIRFEGEANESVLRLNVQPHKVSGDATTPSTVSATTPQATAYLIAA